MAKNVIFRGSAEINKPIVDEATGATAITPGSLLFKSSGVFTKHATAGAGAEVALYIADMNTLLQQGVGTDWTSGDTVVAFEPRSGEKYYALVATAQTIDVLDKPLTSNGDGTLKIGVPATDEILCYADEIITTTAATLVAVKFK